MPPGLPGRFHRSPHTGSFTRSSGGSDLPAHTHIYTYSHTRTHSNTHKHRLDLLWAVANAMVMGTYIDRS